MRLQLGDAQKRAEAAEAALEEERSAHRRALRHKNRELAEAQVSNHIHFLLWESRKGHSMLAHHWDKCRAWNAFDDVLPPHPGQGG